MDLNKPSDESPPETNKLDQAVSPAYKIPAASISVRLSGLRVI